MPSVRSHQARCIWPMTAALGEGPVWIDDEAALYCVDILGATIFRYTPATGQRERCHMPVPITAIAPTRSGDLLCTGHRDIYRFDVRTGALSLLRHVLDTDALRINDGCCDSYGAFWFGTMDLAEREPVGHFYRLAADGACERFSVSFVITNGPAFSARTDIGYFVDTIGRRILRTKVGPNQPFSLQPFALIAEDQGYPDGIAVDADGGVWCAHFGGARVTRFDTAGHVTDVVHLSVSNVTKCAFGGERLDRLFITTARKGLDEDALASQTLGGGLFVAEVGHRGVAASRYCGAAMTEETTIRTCFFESS